MYRFFMIIKWDNTCKELSSIPDVKIFSPIKINNYNYKIAKYFKKENNFTRTYRTREKNES